MLVWIIAITIFVAWIVIGMLVALIIGSMAADPLPVPRIWHPHTEQPEELTCAVIAIPDADDDGLLCRLVPGIYYLSRDGRWLEEKSVQELAYPVFWWAAEGDLIALLPPTRSA